MAALVISISSDSSDESVGSSTSRIILFGIIPAKIPIILPRAPEAGVTVVASPTGVLDLITYCSTNFDSTEDISPSELAPTLLVMRSSLEFYTKFYNSLGRAPNRCSSSICKTRGVVIVHSRNRMA
ncbi:hypothetical protein Tco_0983673 [Tanacetum coccineum]